MLSDFIQTSDINESYIFQETLGEGAFAEVRRAIYRDDESAFAIKIIDKKKITSRDLAIYMNECEILLFVGLQILKLEHPNIIEIYEVYDNPGFFYIVMEYCEGGELYAPNNFHRCSNETQIAEIVLTITDALDFCHSKNIVHRDIKVPYPESRSSFRKLGTPAPTKPENILWTTRDEEAVLKIADFGFAKLSTEQMMTTACGTPMYFSPEILEGKPYDNAVDYWSLGVITYILLSGKTPFEAEDEKELFHRIKNAKIEFPDQQWKYISCSAKDFILRLLDRNPKKRYKADKIRTHPWIISDHKEELLYRERRDNLKRYEASRQVEKIKFMIEKTMVELSEMQDNGEIDLSMIDEAEQML